MINRTPDVMVDLETLGSRPGSVIVSIGAVAFDASTGELGMEFYETVEARSCQAAGLTIDADTVLWWMGQSEAARAAITGRGAKPLSRALSDFSAFYSLNGGRRVWGHGGNFDEPLLSAAFRAAGMEPPWRFSDSRCTRTIFELAGVKPDRAEGVHHNALDDAIAQAKAVVAARAKLDQPRPTLGFWGAGL